MIIHAEFMHLGPDRKLSKLSARVKLLKSRQGKEEVKREGLWRQMRQNKKRMGG